MKNKVISIILATCILLSFTFMSYGAKSETIDNDKDSKEIETKLEMIANGGDVVFGDGVQLHAVQQYNDGITPQWAGGGMNYTHQYLSARALTILRNDYRNAYDLISPYTSTILIDSDWPDEYETYPISGVPTFKSHFYDPSTGKNWIGETNPTAKTKFIEWANKAKQYYYLDRATAMKYLGRALHYLADLNEPHHAQNYTVVGSDHGMYETWANSNRFNYQIESTNKYSNYYGTWNSILDDLVENSADNANNFGFTYDAVEHMSVLEDPYHTVSNSTLKYSQEMMSVFLYRFLKEVGEI